MQFSSEKSDLRLPRKKILQIRSFVSYVKSSDILLLLVQRRTKGF